LKSNVYLFFRTVFVQNIEQKPILRPDSREIPEDRLKNLLLFN